MVEPSQYASTTKYIVKAKFDVQGVVEKPDVVGAVFGQTEGLFGPDLDLRELQKSGRIGRIHSNPIKPRQSLNSHHRCGDRERRPDRPMRGKDKSREGRGCPRGKTQGNPHQGQRYSPKMGRRILT